MAGARSQESPMRLPLSLVFATLVGCRITDGQNKDDTGRIVDTGWCSNIGTYWTEATYTVGAAEYAAALGEDDTLSAAACEQLCRDNHWDAFLIQQIDVCRDDGPDADGDQLIYCHWEEEELCEGRAHAAVARTRRGTGPDPVAAWLARAARAEAGSARAFSVMAVELARFGAPSDLRARCAEAARDEVAHARRMGALCASRGGVVEPLVDHALPDRSLFDFALENAVEGCVFETWAALAAWHQARHAADPELRQAMAVIAGDETRHAELARDLDRWLRNRLEPADHARLDAAVADAFARLEARLQRPLPEPARLTLGLPSPDDAVRLLAGLRAALL
ncbi:MAG: ferritin-like domain-containing protein [Alphaproteobacteria bacterium]|nr:ferritin-like domain-containing protein [Alphaproteobacteria bacterium]